MANAKVLKILNSNLMLICLRISSVFLNKAAYNVFLSTWIHFDNHSSLWFPKCSQIPFLFCLKVKQIILFFFLHNIQYQDFLAALYQILDQTKVKTMEKDCKTIQFSYLEGLFQSSRIVHSRYYPMNEEVRIITAINW